MNYKEVGGTRKLRHLKLILIFVHTINMHGKSSETKYLGKKNLLTKENKSLSSLKLCIFYIKPNQNHQIYISVKAQMYIIIKFILVYTFKSFTSMGVTCINAT